MREGFVVDGIYGGSAVSAWVEGAPRKSLWMGVKLSGRPRSEIAAWRCERCGFLEHYATATPDRSLEKQQSKQALQVVAISLGIVFALLGALLLLRMG
jgi:hypothetical protein